LAGSEDTLPADNETRVRW